MNVEAQPRPMGHSPSYDVCNYTANHHPDERRKDRHVGNVRDDVTRERGRPLRPPPLLRTGRKTAAKWRLRGPSEVQIRQCVHPSSSLHLTARVSRGLRCAVLPPESGLSTRSVCVNLWRPSSPPLRRDLLPSC